MTTLFSNRRCRLSHLFILSSLIASTSALAQFKAGNSNLFTLVTDLAVNRYNVGSEHFFQPRKWVQDGDADVWSIRYNLGYTQTSISGMGITGVDLRTEARLYTSIALSKKWNEYGGVRIDYGRVGLTNEQTLNKTFFFAGLCTGIQPMFFKRVTLQLGADIGYLRNAPANNFLTFTNRTTSENFSSGFGILLNAGIGIKF